MGNYCWDFLNISMSNVLVLIVFACFNIEAYRGDDLGTVFILLELFGFAVLPLIYLLSFKFSTSSAGYAYLCVGFVFLSFAPLLAVMIMSLPGLGYEDEAKVLKYVMFTNPVFAISIALYDMFRNDLLLKTCAGELATQCASAGYHPTEHPLSSDEMGVGRHCAGMLAVGVAYFIILMLSESSWLRWLCCGCCGGGSTGSGDPKARHALRNEPEDGDVAAERAAVRAGKKNHDPIVVNGLTKHFGRKTAVNGLTFSIPKGQCFGLLGVNGAGKTTTFKMLTGECPLSSGSVKVRIWTECPFCYARFVFALHIVQPTSCILFFGYGCGYPLCGETCFVSCASGAGDESA